MLHSGKLSLHTYYSLVLVREECEGGRCHQIKRSWRFGFRQGRRVVREKEAKDDIKVDLLQGRKSPHQTPIKILARLVSLEQKR